MRSRRFLAPLALLVLAAWGNAQAMSCCWLPDLVAAARVAVAEAGTSPMAADHSCCAGATETSADAGTDAASGCGFGESGALAECCERADAAAASAALAAADLLPAPVPAPAWFALLADLALDESPSGFVAPDVTVRTGPPVWLSVGHLLI